METPRMATAASARAPAVVRPSRNAGTMTRPVTWPMTKAPPTVAAANTALPTTETVKIHGSSLTATPRTRSPRRSTAVEVEVTSCAYHPRVTSYSRAERAALCDLCEDLGPDAPTLCGDWTVRQLVTHLFIRERRPLGAPGILIPPLAELAERSSTAAQERHTFPEMVEILRRGAPMWSPFGLMDSALNLSEYFVHHEDVRRAQPAWAPRVLEPAEEDALWGRTGSRLTPLNSTAPVGVVLQRSDTGEVRRVRARDPTVTLVGLPGELLLFGYGRQRVARVEAQGEPGDVARLGATRLGR